MIEKGSFINNRYEVLSRVGAGGMSDVYKAKDHKLNRNVAIKVLKPEFSTDKNFVSKFRVEAQSAASLIHPNIVNVYDVGEDDGLYYIVMELIEGITLKRYIEKKGKIPFREALSIAIQIANGIECAHNNQIVHRDIKPQNIMISREGKVKVTDFGIARAASANTLSGNAMGSVHYISPEQASGKYVDEKSDIYSLGITLYEMLTGKLPFDGDTTVAIALKHIQSNVPSVKELVPTIPLAVEMIVLKCTQNSTDRRYPKIPLVIADMKRAISEPNGDFVILERENITGSTIMITDEERNKIRQEIDTDNEEDVDDEQYDIDARKSSPKTDRVFAIGGVVVGIIALMIIAIIVTSFVAGSNVGSIKSGDYEQETIDPKKTEVPNVVGFSADEAESMLHDKNLGYKYNPERVYSDYPADYIVEQSVKAGDIIDKNTTIILTVSMGQEKVYVPEGIVGKNITDVTEKLKATGLKWDIKYEYSSKEIDSVISCTPVEKAAVAKGDTIELVLSRGTQDSGEIKTSTIPSLEGLKLAKAQDKISSSGFSVGEVRHEYSDKVAEGVVIRQTLKSGTKAPYGATIGLVVSDGPETPEEEEYSASYTFALEDLYDDEGKPMTSGAVSVLLDGLAQTIDPEYSDLANWNGDYTITVHGAEKGKATIQLLINGSIVVEDVVRLK